MKIGLQLYSVRDEAEKDLPGVLDSVAEMGYQGVEFAGFFGHELGQLRRRLDALGLVAIGTHTRYLDIEQDIERVIAAHHTLGASYCTVPYFKADSVDGWREFAETLNLFGGRLKGVGIMLGYHNHHHEFEPVDGIAPYAILRETCDPTLVGLELDVAWAHIGGHAPGPMIESLGDRCPLIHLKDVSGAGTDADIGTGGVDMRAVLKAADQVGVAWGIVERDTASPPTLDSAKANLEALRKLGHYPE